jgi:arylsulfatase A-like enzyme
VDLHLGVAEAVETVAEVLRRAGYRTAAITDSGLFSRHYGQDQGFEWFEETTADRWSLAHTLARARARLAADDGRPSFLVVHTYRVHGPMRTGPEEDPRPAKELLRALRARLDQRRAAGERAQPLQVALEFREQGVALYRDAVADLDRKLGAWLEELEAAGFLEHGVIVLTSDHGEALGEHGEIGHGGDLYDVRLRVPLALAGRGIVPGAVAGSVSLIDVAPTLAELAGVPPDPSWVGRSLLGREPSGPLFAFDLKDEHHQVALVDGERKLLAPDLAALRAGRPSHAFDLGADPGEEANLATAAAWPESLARSFAEALAPFLEVMASGSALELPPEVRAQLEAIGYGE